MKRAWTSKKEPTNPVRKEAHNDRKVKKIILNEILEVEQQQQIMEYLEDASEQIQE